MKDNYILYCMLIYKFTDLLRLSQISLKRLHKLITLKEIICMVETHCMCSNRRNGTNKRVEIFEILHAFKGIN